MPRTAHGRELIVKGRTRRSRASIAGINYSSATRHRQLFLRCTRLVARAPRNIRPQRPRAQTDNWFFLLYKRAKAGCIVRLHLFPSRPRLLHKYGLVDKSSGGRGPVSKWPTAPHSSGTIGRGAPGQHHAKRPDAASLSRAHRAHVRIREPLSSLKERERETHTRGWRAASSERGDRENSITPLGGSKKGAHVRGGVF